MNNLLVIDGSALLSIIFYASISDVNKQIKDVDQLDYVIDQYFRTGHGHYTENVGSFVSMVLSLKNQVQASHLAVCFDKSSETTLRKQKYPFYKANRQKRPKAIKDQMLVLHCLLNNVGIKTFWADKFEADDLAGSLITKFKSEFDNVYFYTKDRDWFQLLDKNVKGIIPMKSEDEADGFRCYYCDVPENNPLIRNGAKVYGKNLCVTEEICKDLFGVYPEQVVDFKALAGDKSDNIPGVKGIGNETAKGLLECFGTAESAIQSALNTDEETFKCATKTYVKRNPYKMLVNGYMAAKDSKELATIKTDIPISFVASHLAYNLNLEILTQAIEIYNLESDLDWVVKPSITY